MKFTLPKNRTAPLILVTILSVLLSLTLGMYHMYRMDQYSYRTKLETYDSLTENVVSLLKQEIENNLQSLQNSANLVAKSGELDKENIASLLPLLADDNSFIDLGIVGIDGSGYNLAGEAINISNADYYTKAREGLVNASETISYTNNHTPSIDFAAPIIENGIIKGILIAKVNAQITNVVPFQSEIQGGSLFYVLNSNNELISFVQDTDVEIFDYDRLIEKGYFLDDENIKSVMSLKNYLKEGKTQEKTYIWNKVPLGINNWYVLVGRVNALNSSTKDILKLTSMMWVLIAIGTFLLLSFMIFMQRKFNRKVIEMLYLDPVTGGSNWYKFRINVNKMLNSKHFGKKKYAIINFDINRFKIINDAYGYQKGDEVLKDIYGVVKKWVRPDEPFTRYAADQFYILMVFHDEQEVIDRINNLNDRLHELRYTRTARIFYGVYNITERQDSIDRMGEFASIAKNNIKSSTDSNISFFDDIARGRLLQEEEIEKSMNEALKNDEFHVYLQPKYMAKEETISGAEALVRWHSNNGTMFSPGYFIPVFEKNGFITELDYYMLNKVCQVIRNWLDKGFTPLPISVNISRLHFANSHLADIISEIVDKYDVPHNLIELELTESAFLQNKEALIKTVTLLRGYGFLVSMDDFGAGYSSLNSLKDLPLDVIKLDGELFRITDEVERGLTVIRDTITMAKDLHMKVVAECIETREQVEFLCKVGCDIIQGYYFARPMPVDQFEQRYFSLID
jgi:diguanylate cyclase (GGDEF)-like protein